MNRRRPALFRGRHFEDGIILLYVRWYLRYSLTFPRNAPYPLGPVCDSGQLCGGSGKTAPSPGSSMERGVRPRLVSNTAGGGLGPWYLAKAKALSVGLSNAYFKSLGLPSLTEAG